MIIKLAHTYIFIGIFIVWMEIEEETLKGLFPHMRGLEVLVDKTIVFLGDSVMRGMYKDMVKFVKCGELLKEHESKRKGEMTFHDDILVYGGDKLAKKTNGKEFREYRVIKMDNGIIIKYHYICRAYNDHVESIIESFKRDPPDVVVVNSCLWDLHRYKYERHETSSAMEDFKLNVIRLAQKLSEIRVPEYEGEDRQPLLIWTTTPPCACDVPVIEDFTEVSDDPNAYNFTAQIDELNAANIWLGQMLPRYSFNVIDLGTIMAKAIHHREKDGVHWNAHANRMFTMLILSRIDMHLVTEGKHRIPTVIYSSLLYVAPPPPAPAAPVRSSNPNPPPSMGGYYESNMNDFNDRYSFGQNDYNSGPTTEYRGSGAAPHPPPHRELDYTADHYESRPPPMRMAPRAPPSSHGPPPPLRDSYDDRYSYDGYTNNYSYSDVYGAASEQRALLGRPRPPPERRHPMRGGMGRGLPQHRYPPPRTMPHPRGPSRRPRPY